MKKSKATPGRKAGAPNYDDMTLDQLVDNARFVVDRCRRRKMDDEAIRRESARLMVEVIDKHVRTSAARSRLKGMVEQAVGRAMAFKRSRADEAIDRFFGGS